jgi:23S rRNA (uracil1939-C5)-methyltransferase
VLGVELVADSIRAANENATLNDIDNIRFRQGSVDDFLRHDQSDHGGFDTVIVDPPRAGMNPKALKALIEMRPAKLMYISCNPATFARDAAMLCRDGYLLPEVQPVDMFPHTMHIELVGRFDRA